MLPTCALPAAGATAALRLLPPAYSLLHRLAPHLLRGAHLRTKVEEQGKRS